MIIHLNYLMIDVFDLGYPDREDSKFSKSRAIGISDDHSQHTEIRLNTEI